MKFASNFLIPFASPKTCVEVENEEKDEVSKLVGFNEEETVEVDSGVTQFTENALVYGKDLCSLEIGFQYDY